MALHPAAGVIRPLVSGSIPTSSEEDKLYFFPIKCILGQKPTKVSMFELLKCLIGDMNMKLDVFPAS